MRFQTVLTAGLVTIATAAPAPAPQPENVEARGDWKPPPGYQGVFNRRSAKEKRDPAVSVPEYAHFIIKADEKRDGPPHYPPKAFNVGRSEESTDFYNPKAYVLKKRNDGPPHYPPKVFNVGRAEESTDFYNPKAYVLKKRDNEKRDPQINYGHKFLLAEEEKEKRQINYGQKFILSEPDNEKRVPPDYDTRFHPGGKAN